MLRFRSRVLTDSGASWASFLGGISTLGERSARWSAAVGEAGMIATDIVGNLPLALAELGDRGRQRAQGRRESDRAKGSRRRGRSGR